MDVTRPFRVGDWTAEPDLDRITRGDEQIHLRPQVMNLLVYLSDRQGDVVRSEDLMRDLWPGKIVTDATLYSCVAELRGVLNGGQDGQDAIQTVPKKGYRLKLPVSGIAPPEPQPAMEGLSHRRVYVVIPAALAVAVVAFFSNAWWPLEPPERSIAVLPFTNMSADPDQEYFSDGISEEILNLLAQVRTLKVVARTSSFSFKGRSVDIATMAEQMNVRHILEGSVRRDGSRVRIAAQLIDAKDSSHLWSEAYDLDFNAKDIFEIQSEIARAITDRLRMTLTGDEAERLAKVPTENTEAYAAYLLGRVGLRDRKVAELRDAVEQFARAIELDPQFAHAYVGLADACWLYHETSLGHSSKHCPFPEGEEFGAMIDAVEPLVLKALSIDDEVGEAWVTLGRIRREQAGVRGNGPDTMGLVREAQAAFKTGIDLSPSFSQAYAWYAESLLYIVAYGDPPNGWLTAWENGHWQAVIERGLEVDPRSLALHAMKTTYPMFSSTIEEAVWHARRMIEIAPNSPQGYAAMARLQAGGYGRLDDAISWWKRAAERDAENASYGFDIARSYCALGDTAMAAAYAQKAAQLLPPDRGTAHSDVVAIEACDLLLSGDVYSGRLEEILQGADDMEFFELRAMIDIAAGRAEDALARYKFAKFCFDDSGDFNYACRADVIRAMQATGDHERARRFAERSLQYYKPWFDRYPAYAASSRYAETLAVLGRTNEALDILEALIASGWRPRFFALEYFIAFDSIRDHPRFQALIAATRADFAQQLENVRAMERRGELPTLQEVQASLVVSPN